MAEDDDKENKTEEPTHQRLEEARKKGNIPNSKEVNNLFILFALTMVLLALAPAMSRDLLKTLTPLITRSEDFGGDLNSLRALFAGISFQVALILSIPMLLAVVAALAAGGLQTRFNVSVEPIIPKLEKLSPMKGLSRMFGKRSAIELLKGTIKIIIVGAIATMAIWPMIGQSQLLPDSELPEILAYTALLAKRMLVAVLCAVFVIAILDYLYQRHDHLSNLHMTKQEIRDEYKNQEGDPHVKGKLRQIRAERSRKRMMANVPKSDVVITNPTHYAVALKYEPGTMTAPVVMAMGVDKAAQRIKDIAAEHKILVMRNPPLARALYANAEVDKEIPLEYYQAVAQVIGYVYKLRGKQPKTITMPEKKKKR